jgi:hypothetical protein
MIPAKVQVLLPLDQPVTEMEHVLHRGTFLCSHFHVLLNMVFKTEPDRKELIKIISTRYLLISLITKKYLIDMILINSQNFENLTFFKYIFFN